jgi:hypothetical protein
VDVVLVVVHDLAVADLVVVVAAAPSATVVDVVLVVVHDLAVADLVVVVAAAPSLMVADLAVVGATVAAAPPQTAEALLDLSTWPPTGRPAVGRPMVELESGSFWDLGLVELGLAIHDGLPRASAFCWRRSATSANRLSMISAIVSYLSENTGFSCCNNIIRSSSSRKSSCMICKGGCTMVSRSSSMIGNGRCNLKKCSNPNGYKNTRHVHLLNINEKNTSLPLRSRSTRISNYNYI